MATVTESGDCQLAAGQCVEFETELETKGPKAIKLQVLPEKPKEARRIHVTIYHDPGSGDSADVLAELEAVGVALREIDYITSPPTRDELKRLSLTLDDADQSLARRYEPLFIELQLDDRFISDGDFWTAIAEHPSLINGPILVAEGRTRICKTGDDVLALLNKEEAGAKKSKGLSAQMVAMMTGRSTPSILEKEPDDDSLAAGVAANIESTAKVTLTSSTSTRKSRTAKVAVEKPTEPVNDRGIKKRVRMAGKEKFGEQRKK